MSALESSRVSGGLIMAPPVGSHMSNEYVKNKNKIKSQASKSADGTDTPGLETGRLEP